MTDNLQEKTSNATLVARLIEYREEQCIRPSPICIEAADEILRLREEVEKWKSLAEANAKVLGASIRHEERAARLGLTHNV